MTEEERGREGKARKISMVKLEFMQAVPSQIPALLEKYENDERSGVITICNQYRNKTNSIRLERERTEKMKRYERQYQDYSYICGIDEGGQRSTCRVRFIACAVILPKDCDILYINDSKQVSPKKRGGTV